MNSKRTPSRKTESPTLIRFLNPKSVVNTSSDLSATPKTVKVSQLSKKYQLYNSAFQKFNAKLSNKSSLRESLTVKRIGLSPARFSASHPVSRSFTLDTASTKTLNAVNGNALSCQLLTYPDQDGISDGNKYAVGAICMTIPEEKLEKYHKKVFTPRKELNILKPLQSATTNALQKKGSKQKIPFKEAQQIKGWILKARPEIERMWRNYINQSNGIDPILPAGMNYKFYVGKGNNSQLIKKFLSSRSWWTATSNPDEANFIWTQWKDRNLLSKFESVKDKLVTVAENAQSSLFCPLKAKGKSKIYQPVEIDTLGFQSIINSQSYAALCEEQLPSINQKMHNRLEFNQHLSNKKGLYASMKNYYEAIEADLFEFLPLTFHIRNEDDDPEFERFKEAFINLEFQKNIKPRFQNLWIIKPGENTNRGVGISVCNSVEQIRNIIKNKTSLKTGEERTFILQKYLERPFLIHKRKFDIRCYALITSINGVIQGYFYSDGYLRTTSHEYSIKDISNNFIHLTNDAIQKHSEDYGKFENGNKLSYRDFQRYLDFHCSEKKINFYQEVLPKIKDIVKDTMNAVFLKIDPNRRAHCIEIFGYDIMLDSKCKPWLIEVNTNPCLELSAPYLAMIIPAMVENAFRIGLDPLFPPPKGKFGSDSFSENKFELIFHQETDGKSLLSKIGNHKILLEESNQVSDNEELFSDDEEEKVPE